MNKKIRIIGFRNALYAGQLKQNAKSLQNPQGVGILLDDMFLTCLATWSSEQSSSLSKPKGPSVLLYPHRQILYTQQYPRNGKLTGFWCYNVSQFKIFGYGQNQNVAVLHKSGNIISKSKIVGQNELKNMQQITYQKQQQKWNKIEQIISNKIPHQNRSLKQFIKYYFINSLKNEQFDNFINMRIKQSEQLYGIMSGNQGLAFCLKDDIITSTGYYKNLNVNKTMSYGRIYRDQVNSTSFKIQEGNFQTEQLFQFQFTERRPQQSYKYSRNYFRQSSAFYNQFIQLNDADQLYKRLDKMSKQYLLNIGSKYGQRIIEGQQLYHQKRRQNTQGNQTRRSEYLDSIQPITNRQYNLNEAKQAIQSQINKRKLNSDRQKVGFHTDAYHYQNFQNKDNKYKSTIGYRNGQKSSNRQQSPRPTSPRKYQYFEQKADSRREENITYRPRRVLTNTVNEFTLYPNPIIERDGAQLERIQRQIQIQRNQRQRIKSIIQYQQQKQIQLKMRLARQIDKENQLEKLLIFEKALVLQKLPTFGQRQHDLSPIKPVLIHREPNKFNNIQRRVEIVNLSPSNPVYGRRYANNYKYSDQRNEQLKEDDKIKQSVNSTKRYKLTDTLSPVNKLYKESDYERPQPSISKSPMGQRRNLATTARRTYTYLD